MNYFVQDIDDGRIQVHTLQGRLEVDALRSLAESGPGETAQPVRVFIVDLSEAEVAHIESDMVQRLAGESSQARSRRSDFRPSVMVVTTPLIRGLVNMMAAYRGDEITIVKDSYDEALAWARAYVDEHPEPPAAR